MLKIYFHNTEVSYSMENYQENDYSFVLSTSEEISIGYYKPINAVYVEMKTANTNSASMNLYYYNGSAFQTVEKRDDTKGLSKSGFVQWNRNLTNESKTTHHGEYLYWYKIKLTVDSSAMLIQGINLVFSNDLDLKEEYPSILEMLPENEASFIRFHVASRKDIVSELRGQNKTIQTSNDIKYIDQFDLLDFEEVRDASKFLTLSKILYWISDAVDDKWFQKAKQYEEKYGAKLGRVNLSIDNNNDGKKDKNEIGKVETLVIERR